nr:NAD synthetase [Gammaproteobacteria bacterium]
MISPYVRDLIYILAAVLFIFDLKWMSHPRTAVRGNYAGVLGMVLAVAATVLSQSLDWGTMAIGVGIGAVIGAVAALRVQMTAMPEMVGLFNGFGGGASVLVAGAALIAAVAALKNGDVVGMQERVATVAAAIIG